MSSHAYGAKRAVHKRTTQFNLSRPICGLILALVVGWLQPTALQAKTLKLLALGDSLTAGYGLAQGEGFVPQLQAWLVARSAEIEVINAGVSGDTTASGQARLGWSLTDDIDAVLVNLGGNDMLRGLPPEETRKNLEAILSELASRGLPTILIRVPASLNFGPDHKASYDMAFPELAARFHSQFIPNFFAALEEQPNRQEVLQTLFQRDGIHPTAQGVAMIVEKIGPEVLSVLQRLQQGELSRTD
ncbi:arylesterase [Aliiroseovarius lamellibrachiae]|uniref:arylesterase n=1 Tax=Aliiroseovarius lamellibrachiae TaxID=1924933 RepID=UPI001BDFDF1A|nr:arylesterase [Aliiroseovarius lamellibrachiae]MBT2130546.1 arylesterase [Aliiroseovarius lamellibrachiae]